MNAVAGLVSGQVIAGKYELTEVLGRGATGTVWKALQLGLQREIAIKVLHPHIAAREDASVRFTREARVAASLDHPSSVAVLDFGDDENVLYLVMELLTGESLRERMSRTRVPLATAITIVRQIAMALAAAHRMRLVHRDIKPENVILSSDGTLAKVVDFGLAFIADDAHHLGRVTLDGEVNGTPAYMSPEQVRGGSIGPPSDVYSLGCVFYELIARRPPFIGAIGEILTRHAYAPPINLRQLELDEPLPVALDELVQAMLSKSPSARPSAGRVAALLAPHESPDQSRVGRTSAPIIERAFRAVPQVTPDQPTEELDGGATFDLGVIGPLPPELELALAVSGILAKRWSNPQGEERIVWAPSAPIAQLAMLSASGKLVMSDVAAGDAAALATLIRAGVVDAIVRPHNPDDFVRRLWRVHRLRVK